MFLPQDRAFVTRVYHKEHIPLPGVQTRYQVLRQAFAALIKDGAITGPFDFVKTFPSFETSISPDSAFLWGICTKNTSEWLPKTTGHVREQPERPEALLRFIHAKLLLMEGVSCLSVHLLLLAMTCQGVCGRMLTRIPGAALSMAGGTGRSAEAAIDLVKVALEKAMANGR
ncbi:hypothetical protein ANO11243_072640 [Dothideomycetidae sp. 11243]|nr:hypothetical protein ANO11243_072640 [fungal sp. No.11243]